MNTLYKAIVSSDWSECLSPSGPYDCLAFNHPEIQADLDAVFRQYTGNHITLSAASAKIRALLPDLISEDQMDAYLDAAFVTYTGVPELIQWCRDHQILFMINSTGLIGYFQRVLAKKLLPPVAVLSANPMIRYPECDSDPENIYELFETRDKARNTEAIARSLGIKPDRIILMGDSGGDGPHFEWGAHYGAFLIGSMTKPSLDSYCRKKDITINLRFGADYAKDERRDQKSEMAVNFMELTSEIEKCLSHN
jgi:phosphoserine phosphatase